MDNILHMVGLALKAGRLEVGEEPVGAACRARDCRLILVARDAADNSFRRVKHFADAGQCLWVSVPYTKEELGEAVGRTACAMAAVKMCIRDRHIPPWPGQSGGPWDSAGRRGPPTEARRRGDSGK